jgi:hypothetical protein
MILFLLYFYIIIVVSPFHITEHPLEKRIVYIHGFNDISQIDKKTTNDLYDLFQKHPFLIFKNIKNVNPNQFLDFVKKFDIDHDNDALVNPEKYPRVKI